MIRIRHILDEELKAKVIAKLAEWRGMSPSSIPEWFELDDHDYADILAALKEDELPEALDDPRE